ncbi:outer membrane lipoprotein carrier protein LolA, partial [Pseudomonas marginalis]
MIHVGAGLPAKSANDNAGHLVHRIVLGFFAGKPAPT